MQNIFTWLPTIWSRRSLVKGLLPDRSVRSNRVVNQIMAQGDVGFLQGVGLQMASNNLFLTTEMGLRLRPGSESTVSRRASQSTDGRVLRDWWSEHALTIFNIKRVEEKDNSEGKLE